MFSNIFSNMVCSLRYLCKKEGREDDAFWCYSLWGLYTWEGNRIRKKVHRERRSRRSKDFPGI